MHAHALHGGARGGLGQLGSGGVTLQAADLGEKQTLAAKLGAVEHAQGQLSDTAERLEQAGAPLCLPEPQRSRGWLRARQRLRTIVDPLLWASSGW